MPTPIITLPIHTIEQARALAGLLRAYIDDQQPDTNDGADWKPDPDLAGIAALYAHLDAGIGEASRPQVPLDTGLGEHIDRAVPLYPDRPITEGHSAMLTSRLELSTRATWPRGARGSIRPDQRLQDHGVAGDPA